jgi:hypothetical protein
LNVGGVYPNPGAEDFLDAYIRLHLCDGHSQRRLTVDDSMLAKQDDLAGCGCFAHVM